MSKLNPIFLLSPTILSFHRPHHLPLPLSVGMSLLLMVSPVPKRPDKVIPNSKLSQYLELPDIPTKYISLISLTLPASLYVVLFYRDAPIGVLSYFRALPRNEHGHSTVGFLVPCHSTPGLAYLLRKELTDGGSWALGCEPPLQCVVGHATFLFPPKDC